MNNIFNSSLVRLSLLILALGILYKFTQAMLPPLENLPINGIDSGHQQQNVVLNNDLKNLYPLVANHSDDEPAGKSNEIISVDDAFIPKSKGSEVAQSKKTDFFMLLRDNNVLKLVAITKDGAIINKRYYAYGSEMIEFAYPVNNNQSAQIPVLLHSDVTNTVLIGESNKADARNFTLSLPVK